jgi:hypothetical protein
LAEALLAVFCISYNFSHVKNPLGQSVSNVPESNCFAYLPEHGGQLVAHPIFGFCFFAFHPLCAASISRKRAVGLGEHCLSTWPRSGSCELRSPARLRLIEGTPQGRQTGVAFSLATLILAKQKKVACCRATPGGFDFVFSQHKNTEANFSF